MCQHGPRDRDGAVAVAIGFHDGEDFSRRSHHLAHGADVCRGGIEVDLEGGGAERAGHGQAGAVTINRIGVGLKPLQELCT